MLQLSLSGAGCVTVNVGRSHTCVFLHFPASCTHFGSYLVVQVSRFTCFSVALQVLNLEPLQNDSLNLASTLAFFVLSDGHEHFLFL